MCRATSSSPFHGSATSRTAIWLSLQRQNSACTNLKRTIFQSTRRSLMKNSNERTKRKPPKLTTFCVFVEPYSAACILSERIKSMSRHFLIFNHEFKFLSPSVDYTAVRINVCMVARTYSS
jgi:hypothetical protein